MACVDRVNGKPADWCSESPDSAADLMDRAGRVRIYEPGQVLFVQGESCQGIHVVRSGLVGLRRSDEDGNSALLGLVGPGDIAGYRALLADDLHSNTAEVLTLCRVVFIERSAIKRLVEQSSIVREHIVQKALADLNRSQTKCAALLTEGLRSRFIGLLVMIHESWGPKRGEPCFELELPIQRKDIAALIGAAPASLSRLISDLEDEGLIRVDGRKVEFSAAARAVGIGAYGSASSSTAPNANVLATLMEARRALLSMIDADDPDIRDALNDRVQAASAQLDGLLAQLSGREATAATKFRRVWEQFKATRQTQIIPAIYAGRLGQAKQVATGIQAERLAMMQSIMSQHAN